MKRLVLAVFLVFVILTFSINPVHAAYSAQYQMLAESLKFLGVFQGTGGGFELEREPNRLEGLVMMIRMLGKESTAKGLSAQTCVFTDVPAWGVGYVNYAYQNGITKGIGNQRFGSLDKLNAKSYVTLMLRALGYNDSQGDFSFDKAMDFASQIKMLSGSEVASLSAGSFLRDHVAMVSCMALQTVTKGSNQSLLDRLVANGAIAESVAEQYRSTVTRVIEASTPYPSASVSPTTPIDTPVASSSPLPTASSGASNGAMPGDLGIVIENIDKVEEVVTIRNKSALDIDLRGYLLVSMTGNQRFVFPSFILKAGTSMTVSSGDQNGDVIWTTANIWNNSKSDPGILSDSTGREVSRFGE